MAKKKGINKLYLAGGAGGLVAVALVAVLFFGVGIEGTLPFIPADEVAPTQLTAQEIQENEQIVIDVTEIIQDPTSFCPTGIAALTECLLVSQGEVIVEIPNEDTSAFTQCGLTDEEINQCNAEIEEIINEINSQINEPPPITNDTDSSPLPPDEQVCDILDLDCGKKPPIQLSAIVKKTDSAGFSSVEEATFDVPQLSFFIEDVVNGTRDFQTGTLELNLILTGEPNTRYIGIGNFIVTIGNETVNEITLSVDETTDNMGTLAVDFIGPAGTPSNNFLFMFQPNFDKFIDGQTTLLDFIVKDFTADFEVPMSDIQFGIVDTSVFSMEIARDDIKIIIADESGSIVRVYPSDSRIVLTSVTGKTDTYLTGTIRQTITQSDFRCNGCGCTQYYVSSDRTFTPSTVNPGITTAAPVISGVLKDELGLDIVSGSGTGTIFDFNELTRNENYTLLVSTTGDISDLEYGKTAESKSFQCSQGGTVTPSSTSVTSGSRCGEPCGTCIRTTTQTFGSVVLGDIMCNVP